MTSKWSAMTHHSLHYSRSPGFMTELPSFHLPTRSFHNGRRAAAEHKRPQTDGSNLHHSHLAGEASEYLKTEVTRAFYFCDRLIFLAVKWMEAEMFELMEAWRF